MDIERVSIRSGTDPYAYEVTIEETDGYSSIYDVLIEDVRRITYNNRDYFLAEDESIDVNSPVVLSVSTTGGVTSYADASARVSSPSTGKYIYTLDAPVAVGSRTDIVIVDGWKIDSTVFISNPATEVVTVSGAKYAAAGVTLKLGSGAGYTLTIAADDGTVIKTIDAVTAGDYDYTMPAQNIDVTYAVTPVTVTLNGVIGSIAATTNGEYSIYVPATAESGKDVTIEITVEKAPSVSTTIKLNDGSTDVFTKTIGAGELEGQTLTVHITAPAANTTYTLSAS